MINIMMKAAAEELCKIAWGTGGSELINEGGKPHLFLYEGQTLNQGKVGFGDKERKPYFYDDLPESMRKKVSIQYTPPSDDDPRGFSGAEIKIPMSVASTIPSLKNYISSAERYEEFGAPIKLHMFGKKKSASSSMITGEEQNLEGIKRLGKGYGNLAGQYAEGGKRIGRSAKKGLNIHKGRAKVLKEEFVKGYNEKTGPTSARGVTKSKSAAILPDWLDKPRRGEKLDPLSVDFAKNQAFGRAVVGGGLPASVISSLGTGAVMAAKGKNFIPSLAAVTAAGALGGAAGTASAYPGHSAHQRELLKQRRTKSKEKSASSKAQVQMADEAFKLIRARFPNMSVGEVANRASRMGREGRPSTIRKFVNAIESGGDNPIGGKQFRKGFKEEMSRKTPGKFSVEEDVANRPDVWDSTKNAPRSAVGQFIANFKRGTAPKLTPAGAV
jgi:hypothetical protein